MQNFICVAIDETDLTYNYYGYQDKKGITLLMRTDKSPTVLRYYVSRDIFSNVWLGRAGYTYELPSELADLDCL